MTYTGELTGSDSEWIYFLKLEASTDLTDIKNVWAWLQPEPIPTYKLYTTIPPRAITIPHIPIRWHNPFLGHKFRLGGSKT